MDLEIFAVGFSACTATGPAIGSCIAVTTATGLPWTATPTTTTNVDIRNINIDQWLVNHPGSSACTVSGVVLRLTGSFNDADWNNTTRELVIVSKLGLVMHSPMGNNVPVTTTGTFRDTQQTLQILP
jgi:hypothetical protein